MACHFVSIFMYLIVETIIFQEVSLDKKCLVKLILPSSFETGLVLVICLSTKFEPSLTFVWKLSSLKEVTVRTEPHYGVTCSITLFLTGKILRLAQFGSVLRRGGLAQSFGGGVYCRNVSVIDLKPRSHAPQKKDFSKRSHVVKIVLFFVLFRSSFKKSPSSFAQFKTS